MDARIQLILQEYREAIVKDVDVLYIIDDLISSQKLTPIDIDLLESLSTRTEKISKLLDIILKNGLPLFQAFVDSLCKPYNWLWKDLQGSLEQISDKDLKKANEDILKNGNVPKLPLYYVRRVDLENKLHMNLLKLERNKMLTLHGMSGSGKTSLVISTLRNDHSLAIDKFNGHVFWISVGDCKTSDQITMLQLRLLKKFEQGDNKMSVSMSSITLGSLNDYTTYVDQDVESLKDKLTDCFRKDQYKDALLVIDDPKQKEVVEAFDVGCKILITTQDRTLVDKSIIETINNDLTEQESLQLISSCIEIEIHKLPDQAKKLHNICHGNPLMMAMLGGYLADYKEDLKCNKKRWNNLIKQLQHKPSFLSRIHSRENPKLDSNFKLETFIKSLGSDELINAYKSLAIIPENIKVSTKALTVILDMSNAQVEDFMSKLKNKSLIIEQFNQALCIYEYEVHDLILSYLKDIFSEGDLRKMHSDLLKRYQKKCLNNSFVNIPNDGYIAYYIGYHILKTNNIDNMWSLFNILYTDLEFIGNKIRLAGPSDTIGDLNRYSEHILKNSSNNIVEFVNKLGKFLSSYGHDLYHYPNTDIIQSILQYESSGELYEVANNLVKKDHNKNHVYLQCLPATDQDHLNYVVLNIEKEFTCLHFWLNFIFIGHNDGSVTLWSIDDYKKLKTFYGHKSIIKSIATNFVTPNKMASICENGSICVWDIDDLIFNGHDEDEDDGTESENHFLGIYDTWNSIFTFEHKSGPLRDVHWGRRSDIFLSYTGGNIIVIYDLQNNTNMDIEIGQKNLMITCSLLSLDDSLAIVGYTVPDKKTFGISMYSRITKDLVRTIIEHNPVLHLSLLPDEDRSILVITTKYIKKHKWNSVLPSTSDQAKQTLTHSKIIELDENVNYELKVAKVGTKDMIFVSTTDFRILIYSISKTDLLCELNNHRSVVTMMDYVEYRSSEYEVSVHLLLTAGDSDLRSARLWFIDESQFNLNRVGKTPKFDCLFNLSPNIFPKNFLDRASPVKDSDLAVRRVKTLSSSNKNSKPIVQKTPSLDRHTIKSFNFLSRQFSNDDPILAVVDKDNHIQVFKGNKSIAKTEKAHSTIMAVILSPCCRFMLYGLQNGDIINFTFKTLTGFVIMEIKEPVNYMEFINHNILAVGGKFRGLMIYDINNCTAKMLIKSRNELGSQELLDNISGKRRTFEVKTNGNRNSYSSSDSTNSIVDGSPSEISKSLSGYSPTIKCFFISSVGMLNVELDGNVKLWNVDTTSGLIDVVIGRQDIKLTCVDIQKNHFVICDNEGGFQIFKLTLTNSRISLRAEKITSHKITEKIISCTISCDENVLAMGCESGAIILWHIYRKILLSKIDFHKEPVYSLKFSPMPMQTCPSNTENEIDMKNLDYVPLVLVSLAGQVCWWNITYIINKKNEKLKKRNRGNNILSPIVNLMSSSPIDFKTNKTQQSLVSCNGFNFDTNIHWEKFWKGKKSKSKRLDLLNCIKLRGEKAFKMIVNDKFSTFVTIDQAGIMYIMNVIHNNKSENSFSTIENQLTTPSIDTTDSIIKPKQKNASI